MNSHAHSLARLCRPVLLFAVAAASAQRPTVTKSASLELGYADEAVVVERDDVVYRYAADGTGTKLETSVLRIQSTAALQNFAVLSFPYASGT